MGEFGRQITERNLNRPPTIQLKPGTRFNVRVNRDMIFVATAVQNKHKDSDPCCKQGLCVTGAKGFRLRSASVS